MAIRSIAAAIAVAVIIALAPSASYALDGSTRNHIVEIRNLQFSPSELTVAPGDTVTWINKDFVPHTATAEGLEWDSGTVGTDGQWQMTIQDGQDGQDGSYFCRHHPSMVGRLIIKNR